MKYNKNQTVRSHKHTDVQQEPRRVAARLEGVVKNKGIKAVRKGRSIHRDL